MKFFSSVTTAAMAGLLLLIPAANGSYYECNSGQIFDISTVRIKAALATHEQSHTIEPDVPSPRERKSFAFDVVNDQYGSQWYLVQYTGTFPTYYFFELGGTDWEPCTFKAE
ncbi:CSEP0085 putative effector protein [Blumeria hordei DH14]|uniref:CSEP0085 putative effector protein n=1 Tax=Blumeria graminis f. sp. hordei (strain DH14) TaxID=546991 RepID=N1JCC2_BLUG1|nr:CSEP0085 putative effector protein [Blumeria hordei DH14]